MEKYPEDSKRKKVETKNLRDIKSSYLLKKVFSFIDEKYELEMIKYSKYFQNLLSLNIDSYKKISGKYKEGGINGQGKEFLIENNSLIFEGEYLKGKRNGKGKEYDYNGKLVFEGEYKNDKRKF